MLDYRLNYPGSKNELKLIHCKSIRGDPCEMAEKIEEYQFVSRFLHNRKAATLSEVVSIYETCTPDIRSDLLSRLYCGYSLLLLNRTTEGPHSFRFSFVASL